MDTIDQTIRQYTGAIQQVCEELITSCLLNNRNLITLPNDILNDSKYKKTLWRRLFRNSYSPQSSHLHGQIPELDKPIRKRVLSYYTKYLHYRPSNTEHGT